MGGGDCMRQILVLLAMLGALILASCGQQTTAKEQQGIIVNARDGAQITRFDVQTGADGLIDLAIDWTD